MDEGIGGEWFVRIRVSRSIGRDSQHCAAKERDVHTQEGVVETGADA